MSDSGKRPSVEQAIDDAAAAAESFSTAAVARIAGVTRQAAYYHLRRRVEDGTLMRTGSGRGARYVPMFSFRRSYALEGLSEDTVWNDLIESMPDVTAAPKHTQRVLQYAVTEMVNNAVDHSAGTAVSVGGVTRDRCFVAEIVDDGVGVFRHICESMGLPSDLAALDELQKGKRTTFPERHSGEGIFFTSKVIDRFELESGELRWIVDNDLHDAAVGVGSDRKGTRVRLEHLLASPRVLTEVFDEYATTDYEFDRTRVTVRLLESGRSFISRSQAKRLGEGLDKFREVTIDFSGVEEVGQGFVDELFRVWQRNHPDTRLVPMNMNRAVQFMVDRTTAL